MADVEDFLKKFSCVNCGNKSSCHYSDIGCVCHHWKKQQVECEHKHILVSYCESKMVGFPEDLKAECMDCGEEIKYKQIHRCIDCNLYETGCVFHISPSIKEHANPDDCCSRWEKK